MKLQTITSNNKGVEIASAIAAGLGISVLVCLISIVDQDSSFDFRRCFSFTLLSVASYSAVALLLHRYWTGLLKRMVPIWILIAFFGTALLVSIIGIDTGIFFWKSSQRVEQNLAEFMLVQLEDVRVLFILVCCFTLPITATVYYAGSIVRAARRWHNRSDAPPSILGNQRT